MISPPVSPPPSLGNENRKSKRRGVARSSAFPANMASPVLPDQASAAVQNPAGESEKEAAVGADSKVDESSNSAEVPCAPLFAPEDIGTKTTVYPPDKHKSGGDIELYLKMWQETEIKTLDDLARRWDEGFKYQVSKS